MRILSNVSENIKSLMQEQDLNRSDLGKAIGIAPSTIAHILSNVHSPSLKTLIAIADYFQVSTDFIVGLEDIPKETTFLPAPPFSKRFTFLLQHFKVSKYRICKTYDISPSVLDNWQKNITTPSVESAVKLAQFFDCSLDFVLGREK